MFDLFYVLTVLLGVCTAFGTGAFFGWLLIERKNAPYKHLRGDQDDEM